MPELLTPDELEIAKRLANGDNAVKAEAEAIYLKHVAAYGNGGWNSVAMKFLSECFSVSPDNRLKAMYRKRLLAAQLTRKDLPPKTEKKRQEQAPVRVPDVRVYTGGKYSFQLPLELKPLQWVEDEDEDGHAPAKGYVLEDAEGVAVAYFNPNGLSQEDVKKYAEVWMEGYLAARLHQSQ